MAQVIKFLNTINSNAVITVDYKVFTNDYQHFDELENVEKW